MRAGPPHAGLQGTPGERGAELSGSVTDGGPCAWRPWGAWPGLGSVQERRRASARERLWPRRAGGVSHSGRLLRLPSSSGSPGGPGGWRVTPPAPSLPEGRLGCLGCWPSYTLEPGLLWARIPGSGPNIHGSFGHSVLASPPSTGPRTLVAALRGSSLLLRDCPRRPWHGLGVWAGGQTVGLPHGDAAGRGRPGSRPFSFRAHPSSRTLSQASPPSPCGHHSACIGPRGHCEPESHGTTCTQSSGPRSVTAR